MRYKKEKFNYSRDKGVWHNANHSGLSGPPSVLIKGDRMVHADFGRDAYGFNWAGSTATHWHGWGDMTFDEAYLWVLDGTGDDEPFWKDSNS